MEKNIVHNVDFLNNTLPDKCANLIIADPPYFEVKGEFDFIWKSFDDYLKDVEKWCLECKRLLADNGTLFWYGHAKKIAYTQIIFDKHFHLENNLVWKKTDCQTRKGIEDFRMFAPITERILMYSNGDDYHNYIRNSLIEVQKYLLSLTSVNELSEIMFENGFCKNTASANSNARSILTQSSFKPQFITKNQYDCIKKEKKEYSQLVELFENKKKKELAKRRFFENNLKLTDILSFSQQVNITCNYDHETCKPEKLTRALIMTCSRPNDLVLVPFAGSGTECAMSVKEGRKTIGFEITEKYAEMANKRVKKILKEPTLF